MGLVADLATCPYGDLRAGAVLRLDLVAQISPIWCGDMMFAPGDCAQFSVFCSKRVDVCEFRLFFGTERQCPVIHALGLSARFTISDRNM